MESKNGSPSAGAIQTSFLIQQNVISSTVLGLAAYWSGSKGNVTEVGDLLVQKFKSEDVYSALSKLRVARQLVTGETVRLPTGHRSDL